MKLIPGYYMYEVDSSGKIYNTETKTYLKPWVTRGGYLQVRLYDEGKRKAHTVHRLVALTYIENPENKSQVNHVDGNKLNNHVSNLEWMTHQENGDHAKEMGLLKPRSGPTHPCARLTWEQVREIRAKYVPIKYSCYKLATEYGIGQQSVSDIVRGISWKE